MFLLFFFLITTVESSQLEIKLDGKTIHLPSWSAKKQQYGTVLLINGGKQSHWSILLAHLAVKLADNGWQTILLNCTKATPESRLKELPEVVRTLRQQQNNRIIVLHYGEQLKSTLNLFKNTTTPLNIEGLILLSAYDVSLPIDHETLKLVPLLDLSGQFDYPVALEQLQERRKVLQGNKYLAIQLPGANHDYEYTNSLLLSLIHGWMFKLSPFKIIIPPIQASYIVNPLFFLQKNLPWMMILTGWNFLISFRKTDK